eukprot:scaffold291658_cov23-Prasinocladus_malaysianus.AAC.1
MRTRTVRIARIRVRSVVVLFEIILTYVAITVLVVRHLVGSLPRAFASSAVEPLTVRVLLLKLISMVPYSYEHDAEAVPAVKSQEAAGMDKKHERWCV